MSNFIKAINPNHNEFISSNTSTSTIGAAIVSSDRKNKNFLKAKSIKNQLSPKSQII